ncbi:rhomboid family intramembrane serine protease [Neorhizobium alkalisoli]|uniref:Membrane associated rhomboid family serine protease n=1 Tax=Neorhizobium alkalisoli TaxID=528178 RepID=A0A561Q7Q0_9HYPH|nr:rhomboid family intramembrane serine protease [Neorhizobium alkalisoli]TWF46370.1 membrane associated rhomboid family serine protease [Neorhizobium alkalisoli]
MNDRPDAEDAGEDVLQEEAQSQPVFNLPRSLVVTIVLLAVIYAVDAYLLSEDMQTSVMIWFAFTPLRYIYPLTLEDPAWLWTPVTYSLLHGNIQHIGFNALWLTAFGAPVVRRIGTLRYILFWILSAAAAAFFHAMLNWGSATLLIGASGVVSALMGAACRFAFPPRGGYDRTYGHLYPRQSIFGVFRNRTVVIFTLMWLLGNVLIAVGLPLMGGDIGEIAWDAHIGGFLFGFLLFQLFDPLPKVIPSQHILDA